MPTYDIDLIWHAHMLHPEYYNADTLKLLGRVRFLMCCLPLSLVRGTVVNSDARTARDVAPLYRVKDRGLAGLAF